MGRLQDTKSIGLAIAKEFSQQGAKVIITGRMSKEKGLQIAKDIGAIDYLCLDASSEEDWQAVQRHIDTHCPASHGNSPRGRQDGGVSRLLRIILCDRCAFFN